MKLSTYYSLFNYFKTGKTIAYGIKFAKLMGIRYLLVRMDTNFICNLRCKTCYFSGPKANKLRIPPMKLDFFEAIARDVFPKTRILFLSCGGEPLMTKRFEDFLEVTGKYSIPYVGYVTNGLLLNENTIRSSIENKVKEITISIDGATKETYEYIRLGGDFEKLMSNLILCKEIFQKVKRNPPSLRFNYTITRSNHHEMPRLVEIARNTGVSQIKFRIYSDWGGKLDFNEESLAGYERSFNESLDNAKKIASESGIYVIAPQKFNLDPDKDKPLKVTEPPQVTNPPCLYPWFHRYIDPLGRVRICANLPLSSKRLGIDFSMRDFEGSPEETARKSLLCSKPSESCFGILCKGSPFKRANDDVNFQQSRN